MSGNGKPHSSASRGKNKGKGSEPSRQNGRGGHNGRSRGGPTPRPVNRQRDLQARASARKEVVLQKLAQSHEEFAKGNDFYEAGDYVAAIDAFKRACALYKTTPKFAMKLLEALLKHNEFDEAVNIATFILAIQPHTSHFAVEARFSRAVALHSQQRFGLASTDYKDCLDHQKTSAKAQEALDLLDDLWEPEAGCGRFDEAYPDIAPCTAMHHLECPSDSEDYVHTGNGQPCWHYNHDGCKSGVACLKKHAPDSRTVRDKLGRNVCLFSIFGRCHFKDPGGNLCWYSHSTEYLPQQGWWNNPTFIAHYQRLYDFCKSFGGSSVMDLMLGGDMNGMWQPWEQSTKLVNAINDMTSDGERLSRNVLSRIVDKHIIENMGVEALRVTKNSGLHALLLDDLVPGITSTF